MWKMWQLNCNKLSSVLIRRYLIRNYAEQKVEATTTVFSTPEPPLIKPTEPTNSNIDILINPPESSNVLKLEMFDPLPETDDMRKTVSFDEVPGPPLLRYLSKLWSYVPLFGNHITTSTLQYVLSAGKIFGSQLSWGKNLSIFRYLLNEYGPVVRLHGPFGGDVVILSRPEHAHVIFQNEGPYPIRSSLDCVEKYRLQHRLYKQAGPFVMFGPQWEAIRKNVEPALQNSLGLQYNHIMQTTDDFIERILAIRNRQQEVPKTFQTEIKKWSTECLCSIMFNKRLGFLDTRGLSSTSETYILLEALNEATSAIRKCEFGLHLWKFIETPAWKKLVLNCDTIDHILGNYLRKAQDSLRDKKDKQITVGAKELSLIDCFLLKDSMLPEDILTVVLDMMLLGVNMTSHTAGFLMYHLAKNPRAQYKLYKEIKSMPQDISREDLKEMPYLRACLHESLRLKPPMPVLSRILTKDISVHGYKVPKGTFMLIATNLSNLREEHFEDPLKFKPERWTDIEADQNMEALATIPFGHGPKACLARDLAEVQIYALIVKILRKFRIEYHYGDIDTNNKLLSPPSRPFRFRFVDRD